MSASALDDVDRRARILALIADGLPPASAASIVGVAGRTFRDWQARAAEDPDGKFGEFFDEVAAAESLIERVAVKCIHQAIVGWTEQKIEEELVPVSQGEGESEPALVVTKRTTVQKFDWRAAADFLERRFPQRWGARDTSEEPDKHVTRFTVEGDNPFLFVGNIEKPHEDETPEGGGGSSPEGDRATPEGARGADPGEA